MRKLTGNCKIDYLNGVADGRKEGLRDMFLTHTYILLPAMYNAKDDDIITDRYFGEYAQKVEKEIQRIIDEVFDGDVTQVKAIVNSKEEDLTDKARFLLAKVEEMRLKCRMGEL